MRHLTTTIKLVLPNIGREFAYDYPYDLDKNREEEAFKAFYEQEAPTLFALYGYAPMDVKILVDGIEVGAYRACYQETLWHSFFCEGGASWHGRFGHFSISLISFRHREDERNNVELSKAA